MNARVDDMGMPANEPAAPSGAEAFDYDALFGEGEHFGEPQGSQGAQGAPPAQPEAPATGDESLEGSEELTPEQIQAIAAASEEQQPQPQQPQQPDLQTAQQQAIDHLAKQVYALSEEDAKALISEPDKIFPRLAAQLHMTVAQQIGSVIQQVLPQQVKGIVDGQMKAVRAEQEFFGRFPHLRNPKFRNVVLSSIKMAKAAEPGADREQIMESAAMLAAHRLKLQPKQQRQQPQQQPPAQQPQRRAAFVPAPPSAAPPVVTPPPKNPFEELAEDPMW